MSLIERNIQSLTFNRQATPHELIRLLVLIAKKPQEIADGGPLDQQLKADGIENITLNSRIFVATDMDQYNQDLEGSIGLTAMFKQFLQGNLDNVDVDGILDLLRDPDTAKDEFKKYLDGLPAGTSRHRREGIRQRPYSGIEQPDRSGQHVASTVGGTTGGPSGDHRQRTGPSLPRWSRTS